MKNSTKESKKVAMPRVTYLDRILNYLTEIKCVKNVLTNQNLILI